MTDSVQPELAQQQQNWRRYFEIRSGWREDETERLRTLFGILMIASAGFGLAVSVVMLIGGFRRMFSSIGLAFVAAAFAGSFIPISFIARYLARRGNIRRIARIYVWVMFVMVMIVALLFNGYQSVVWFILFWPVALAGILLAPINSIYMVLIALGMYGLVYFAEVSLGYVPPFAQDLLNYRFLSLNFTFIFLIGVPGILIYLVSTNTHLALEDRAAAEATLRDGQEELVQRVDERTLALANRATQLQVIAEVIRSSGMARDPDRMFDTVVNTIAERMDFYHVGVFVIDATGEWAELRAVSSDGGQAMLTRGHRLRVGQQGIVGFVTGTGLPRYASSVGEDAVWFNNPDLPETKSEIALPLNIDGRLVGVLDIQTQEIAAFDNEDVQVLQILADGLAASYRNALILEENRQAIARYEQLQQEDAIRAWRQALARQSISRSYAYESGVVLAKADAEQDHASLALPGGVVTDVEDDGQYRLMAPISVSGNNVGLLTFRRMTPWTEETVRLAENVIAQLDLALTNARLLEETRLRASQEAARGEIVSRVRAMTSTDAILRNAAEELGRALDVERSRIQLVRYD